MKVLKRLFAGTLGAMVLATLNGCIRHITITADPTQLGMEPVSPPKLETRVGYSIPEETLNTEVETPVSGGDYVCYFPYRDLEPGLHLMLQSVYGSVTKLGTDVGARSQAGNDIKYFITPKLSTSSRSDSKWQWPPTSFSVELTCDIRDADGKLIASPRVVGNGQRPFRFRNPDPDFGSAGKRAMVDALQQMRKALLELRQAHSSGGGASAS